MTGGAPIGRNVSMRNDEDKQSFFSVGPEVVNPTRSIRPGTLAANEAAKLVQVYNEEKFHQAATMDRLRAQQMLKNQPATMSMPQNIVKSLILLSDGDARFNPAPLGSRVTRDASRKFYRKSMQRRSGFISLSC